MAWTAPTTRATGDLITASIWNVDLVDNLTYLKTTGLIAVVNDTTLGAAAASIDVQNISAAYEHLELRGSTRSTSATGAQVYMRMNNDSAGNYDWRYDENAVGGGASGDTVVWIGETIESDAAANIFGPFSGSIPDYKNTARHKGYVSLTFSRTAATYYLAVLGGIWKATAAINRLTFLLNSGNLDTGSRITIYGMDV